MMKKLIALLIFAAAQSSCLAQQEIWLYTHPELMTGDLGGVGTRAHVNSICSSVVPSVIERTSNYHKLQTCQTTGRIAAFLSFKGTSAPFNHVAGKIIHAALRQIQNFYTLFHSS